MDTFAMKLITLFMVFFFLGVIVGQVDKTEKRRYYLKEYSNDCHRK